MTIARGIAQARSYQGASRLLIFQVLIFSIVVGAKAPDWWWGVVAFFGFTLLVLNRWTRLAILIGFSSFWAFAFWVVSVDIGAGYWAYLAALGGFLLSFSLNSAGMIGLEHSVPEYT